MAQPAEPVEHGPAQTQVEMVNVNIRLDPTLVMRIRRLAGQFLPTRKGQPPTFDDNLSYIVSIDSAEPTFFMRPMNQSRLARPLGIQPVPCSVKMNFNVG